MILAWLRRCVCQFAIAVLAAHGTQAYAQTAQPVPEFKLKAAFVYNFALFTDWPAGVLPDGAPLQLCFVINSASGPALTELNGRMVKGRRIVARGLSEFDDVRHCHMLFLASAEREYWPQIRKAAAGLSVLTVSDDAEMARGGAIITLYLEENRIAFDIDLSAARQAQLTISSKLLRLARSME